MINDSRITVEFFGNRTDRLRTNQVRVLDAQELFGQSSEVRLRHCDEEYRLMITRNNKLILTK